MAYKDVEKRREANKRWNRTGLRARTRERKRLLLEQRGQRCVDCGYNGHPAALQFDHVDPKTKLFHLSARMNAPWAVLVAEAEKCVVRCANCHSIKTALEDYK